MESLQHDGSVPNDDRTAAALEPRDTPVLVREFIYGTVAAVFDVDEILLDQPNRGRARIALARQAGMYLAHVACGLSFTAVGRVFGRDRSTVAHACRLIEDARERRQFDKVMTMLERSVRVIVETSPALRRDIELAEGRRVDVGAI